MKYVYPVVLVSISLLVAAGPLTAQIPECDTQRQCTGLALTLSAPSGDSPQEVRVNRSPSLDAIRDAMTVEMWMKPQRQNGKRQYIAAIWGPHAQGEENVDPNDVWALYIDVNDDVVFELNSSARDQGSADNTIVRTSAAGLYDAWHHIAAVFDGSTETASIYIDGALAASARNADNPISRLRVPESQLEGIQLVLGGSNMLAEDRVVNRNFLGQLDEIQIWNFAMEAEQILCNHVRSKVWNWSGLVAYYRCNTDDRITLCDGSPNGNDGLILGGASNQNSDRQIQQTITLLSENNISGDLNCDNTAEWTVRIVDNAPCGNRIRVRPIGQDRTLFSVVPNNYDTVMTGVEKEYTVTLNTNRVGRILAQFRVETNNACRRNINIPVDLNRRTELEYSVSRIDFDSLYAGCVEVPFQEEEITICNRSSEVTSARQVAITSLSTDFPEVFEVIPPPGGMLIPPDGCITVRVRFHSRDSSEVYDDTLRVVSEDQCNPLAVIPLNGIVQEVIQITTPNGQGRIDTINFPSTCVNQLSDTRPWTWQNLLQRSIDIDTIIMPDQITGSRFAFPTTLPPNTGFRPSFFRFAPTRPGLVNDSVVIVTSVDDCTIERKIYIRAFGFQPDNQFVNASESSGNVDVGQESMINVPVINEGTDPVEVSFYFKIGDVFFFAGARTITLGAGRSATVPIIFRPLEGIPYSDTLCMFETRCFTTKCIPINGTGILRTFEYEPIVLRTSGVVSCEEKLDTIVIHNRSDVSQTLTDFAFLPGPPAGRYSLIDPPAFPPSMTIPAGGSETFILIYRPNDPSNDRADREFLKYETIDGEWKAPLFGTSFAPRLFATPETDYLTVEVGDTKVETLLIQNISSVDVRLDLMSAPPPFRILNPRSNIVLAPNDTLHVHVEFTPDSEATFTGSLQIVSEDPCLNVRSSGELRGKGVIEELQVLNSFVAFSHTRPCDCRDFEIILPNLSKVNDAIIDSIWIEGQGLPNGLPEFFSWSSSVNPANTLPYAVPENTNDTLTLSFCPRSPAEDQFISSAARLHIRAHGETNEIPILWQFEQEVFLSGLRAITYRPEPSFIEFPVTPVDVETVTSAIVTIPGVLLNPFREAITIDTVTFDPDERVFSTSVLRPGTSFPVTINPDDTLELRVAFKARIGRIYTARMNIHLSEPCPDIDTTILVTGQGFARPASVQYRFSNDPEEDLPTFRINNCDTLCLPIYSSGAIDGTVVDTWFTIEYDTTEFRYIGVDSPYLNAPLSEQCDARFLPSITTSTSASIGIDMRFENICKINTDDPIVIAKFISKTGQRATVPFTVGSIQFDTQDVLNFTMIGIGGSSVVVVEVPDFEIFNTRIDFDSVAILNCARDTLFARNTGDVPITIDELFNLPEDVTIIESVPPLGSVINTTATAMVVLEFCPQKETTLGADIVVQSTSPCILIDNTSIAGTGFAPDIRVRHALSLDFDAPEDLLVQLGDTITYPVYLDTDINAVYQDVVYWQNGLSFDIGVIYNPRALQFLEALSDIDPALLVDSPPGNLTLRYTSLDTVRQGEVAALKFRVAVPDQLESPIFVDAFNYQSDSLMFLDISPEQTISTLIVHGRCNVTSLNYTNVAAPQLYQNTPNPFEGTTNFRFRIQETVPVFLKIYAVSGELITTLLDGSVTFRGGEYSVEYTPRNLDAGLYYYVLEAGVFRDSRPMLIVK